MAEFNIERMEDLGYTATVVDTGKLFSTYREFATAAGHGSAAANDESEGQQKVSILTLGNTYKVLARGDHSKHGYKNVKIYVIESDLGEKFLVGDSGLVINKPEGADDMKTEGMKKLHEMGYDELNDHVKDVIKEMRRKAHTEGYGQGKFDAQMDDDLQDAKLREISETYITTESLEKLRQDNRDEIVAKAKADVKALINRGTDEFAIDRCGEGNVTYREEFYAVEHIINKNKNTVVSLVFSASEHGISCPAEVRHRGVAKCDPSDCFNVHIGRAIALRRALGLGIPSEYLNAPQPAEVRVGDDIRRKDTLGIPYEKTIKDIEYGKVWYKCGEFDFDHVLEDAEIIDDSRE